MHLSVRSCFLCCCGLSGAPALDDGGGGGAGSAPQGHSREHISISLICGTISARDLPRRGSLRASFFRLEKLSLSAREMDNGSPPPVAPAEPRLENDRCAQMISAPAAMWKTIARPAHRAEYPEEGAVSV